MEDEVSILELSVVAGIVWNEGRILICQRPAGGHMPGFWEFPGGKIEEGENDREALQREICEELGIAVRVGRLHWETCHSYPDREIHLRFYDCEWASGVVKNLGVAGHEWVHPASLGDFDFLPADAQLIETLMNGEESRDSGKEVKKVSMAELSAAYDTCMKIVVGHYENFPVASKLLPAKIRPHVAAVYAFARGADDIADTTRPAHERIARLDEWEDKLVLAQMGVAETDVFIALSHTIQQFNLPLQPFLDLLSAFKQDVTVLRYPNYEALLDYCRRSADPVGRIVLMLHGIRDEEALHASDAICTALQIANHLQDVKEDAERGIVYMPQDEMKRFAVSEDDLLADVATPQLRAFLVFQIKRTKRLFRQGLPLLYRTRGALGRELRAIWRGGIAALDSISRQNWDVCAGSPHLNGWDKAKTLFAAFRPVYRLESNVDRQAENALNRAYCRWFIRASRSNFYLSFFSLPAEKRRAITAVYAYCRMADDIADEPGEISDKKSSLREWKNALEQLGEESQLHPIIGELAWASRKYDLPPEHLRAICDGVGMDLEERRIENLTDLENYCDKVASAVGLACLSIFGAKSEFAKDYAVCLGRALQMTNILRDVWEDAEQGRIYLPQGEMEKYGVTDSDLRDKTDSPQVLSLLGNLAHRARDYYEGANEALNHEKKENLLPARIMGRIYRRLLSEMEQNHFRHMDYRPSLNSREKLLEALRCFLEA